MKARAAAALLALACLLTAGCQSVPPDVVVETPGEKEIAGLETYGLRLAELSTRPDSASLAALRGELDRTAASPGLSRQLSARVDGLRAEAALLAGDSVRARALAAHAASLTDREEGVWRVRAALESDDGRRLALLEEGIAKADAPARLRCERGRLLLASGRYAEAAQDLDEGLRGLAPDYRVLYEADRDTALSLARAGADGVGPGAAVADLGAALTVRAMVGRSFEETRFLSALTTEASPNWATQLAAVKAAGLLLDPDVKSDTVVTRKDVAFFLWGIVARLEHDARLLTVYRTRYTASPVPDVPIDAPWFDATLGVVEQEIMDLRDGVHFQPDAPVTGLDFLAMLAAMRARYR
jgi:hypothetical protein